MRYTIVNQKPHAQTRILEVVITAKSYDDAKTWAQNYLDQSSEWVISKTDSL